MFVEVKHVYNCNLYNLILHKYSHHIDNIYIYRGLEYLCKYRFYINQSCQGREAIYPACRYGESSSKYADGL